VREEIRRCSKRLVLTFFFLALRQQTRSEKAIIEKLDEKIRAL